jgi:hypothetical protein
MSTSGHRLCIPAPLFALLTGACLLVVAGCSGGDDPSIDSSAPAATPPATSDIATPSDTADIPLTSDLTSGTADIVIPPPADSSDIALPPPVVSSDIPASVIIEATVGADTGPERLESVPLGSNVVLSVTNPTSDDEFHLHGYELGDAVVMPAGQTETFSFLADQAGEFELESHETGDVLLVLSVN